jgi:hypothetical protein
MYTVEKLWFVLLAVIAACGAAKAADPVTLDSLLREMADAEAVAKWPDPAYVCRQASSYDRRQTAKENPDPFANDDRNQFIRQEQNEGRAELVMLDEDGPGAIVRFWLTTDSQKAGAIRIYLDGSTLPAVVFPAFDLMKNDLGIGVPFVLPHPGYTPDGPGGNTLWLPIPYARHCKVTWEERSSGARYYQIDTRTYPAGTAVQTFEKSQLEKLGDRLASTGWSLQSPPPPAGCQAAEAVQLVGPGGALSVSLPDGPAAVRVLELKVETNGLSEVERALRSLVLKVDFDGEESVWCPVTDFFGSGVGINVVQNWRQQVGADGTMRSRWVMPYAKSGTVCVLNIGSQAVRVLVRLGTSAFSWNAERSMHFHAVWHYVAGLQWPPASDWNLVTVQGRGVYAGDSLSLYNPVSTWYGEGDEKIRVDGEAVPSHLGTGTEDYYNYSYAPKPVFQTPFSSLVREDSSGTQGWNVMERTRSLDGIPFTQSLRMDFELIAWKKTSPIACATTYWYAFPGAKANVQPQPEQAAAHVPTLAEAKERENFKRPGAVELEGLNLVAKEGDFPTETQAMDEWGRGNWSDGCQFLGKATKVGNAVELAIPAPDAAPRQIVLYATQAPDYGILSFTVNGKPSAAVFDGYASSVHPGGEVALGLFTPEQGVFRLRVTVSGANPLSRGAKYFFGLDCVTFKSEGAVLHL